MFFDQLFFWEKKLKESWSHKSDFVLLKNKVIDGAGKSSERAYRNDVRTESGTKIKTFIYTIQRLQATSDSPDMVHVWYVTSFATPTA